MPWKDRNAMDLRKEFVLRAVSGDGSLTRLCAEYGISRKTGYKWKQRMLERGLWGLAEESRRPDCSPGELGEAVVCEMVRLKQAHADWGARKLRRVYQRLHGGEALPSESSFKRVLDRAGLVEHRVRRPAEESGRLQKPLVAEAPNDVWTVDFKGWWYAAGRRRCQPLTVRDAYSRYILGIRVPPDSCTGTIREEFERLFACYGLPGAIRSDNGPPFAVWHSLLGLSQLSAWWLALGIDLDRIDPGHPEQNGGHERMHRDIAMEVQGRVEGGLEEQAVALEIWRNSYNQERPHEAIGLRTPGELYEKSSRTFTGTPASLEYPPDHLQRQVTRAGQITLFGVRLPLSVSLAGWNVGLKATAEDVFTVHFGRLCLGHVDLSSESFQAVRPQPRRREAGHEGMLGAPPQAPGFSALTATDQRSGAEAHEELRPAIQ